MICRLIYVTCFLAISADAQGDQMKQLQADAIANTYSEALHWGANADAYSSWTQHTNRLIPVYTFGTKDGGTGIDLTSYTNGNSVYRNRLRLSRLYHSDVENSVSEDASYLDQTNVFDLQRAAVEAGRKYVIIVVFDGMDWHTTRAAAIYNRQCVGYDEGRGVGTHFQEYDADGTTQYGWMVTSPYCGEVEVDVDKQLVVNSGEALRGGYNAQLGGQYPWSIATELEYLINGPENGLIRHAYTDSAASATSMFSGIKTFNDAVGVCPMGEPQVSIAHLAQANGYKVGIVTSVPISHATPAAAYTHNVSRDDYQDISRDLLGLPSISHPRQPLPGVDVLIGGGYGVEAEDDSHQQGENYVPGNKYLTRESLQAINIENEGAYVVSLRTPGGKGGEELMEAASRAARQRAKLFGFYGVSGGNRYHSGHLPYATADKEYDLAPDVIGETPEYSQADIEENPTLGEMTKAGLYALSASGKPFWLLVEAGDIDWANHANNIDNSIGAVNSGDDAVRVITDWVEQHSNWDETVMIVTADHGHYLVIDNPEMLTGMEQSDELSSEQIQPRTTVTIP